MLILPAPTPLIQVGDDLVSLITDAVELEEGDILAVSSKAAAAAQGAHIDLTTVTPSDEAIAWEDRLQREHRDPRFREAVLQEAKRLNGTVRGDCPLAMLAELRPDGLGHGTILAANAGLDRSNTPQDTAIGWPLDPVQTVRDIRIAVQERYGIRIGVLLTDSCCRPRRRGVTAIALTVSGFLPFVNDIGHPDLYGNPLRMTEEAVADQLATAANSVMGNAAQSTPAAVIRDHNIGLADYDGWVDGIDPAEDLFRGAL